MSLWRPLLGPRFMLRDLRPDDLEAFAAYRSDPDVAAFQGWTPPYPLEAAQQLHAAVQATPFDTPGTWYQVALADRETGALAGDIGLHFLDEAQVEVGFTLARAHQGRGLLRAALPLVLDRLFREHGKHRVVATVDLRNTRAQRLLEAVAFRQEGHLRKNVFFKGEWGDELLYACLAEEWRREA